MKFRSEIIINKQIKEVYQFTINPKNLSRWVDGFEKYKLVSGKVRQVGSIGIQIYNDKEGKLEVREEVLAHEPGKSLKTHLSHKNMETILDLHFLDQGNSTKLAAEAAVKLKPLVFNLMAPFVKNPKKKQQLADLKRLKRCIEQKK
jgi:carbon monoxide dehydrogenase subunit G